MMAEKRQRTKLELDMIQCEKDGYGVRYGLWKAAQKPVPIVKKEIPEGLRVCVGCGKPFKPKTPHSKQLYCDVTCQKECYRIRYKERNNQSSKESYYRKMDALKQFPDGDANK